MNISSRLSHPAPHLGSASRPPSVPARPSRSAASPNRPAAAPEARPAGGSELPEPLARMLAKVRDRLAGRVEQGDLTERQRSGLGKALGAFENALEKLAAAGDGGELHRGEVAAGARKALGWLQNAVQGILGGSDGEGAIDLTAGPSESTPTSIDRLA